MSDLFNLLQEADLVSLEMERAKLTFEVSKAALEQAKEDLEDARKAFEKVLFKADELAIPRQRIRRLIEERTQALVASGLMEDEARASLSGSKASSKGAKKVKGKAKSGDQKQDSASMEMN